MTTNKDSLADAQSMPSNPPVNPKAVRPELPSIDQRRYRALMTISEDGSQSSLKSDGASQPTTSETRDNVRPVYPFTKGQRLVNDGVGFGERVEERRVPAGPAADDGVVSAETLRFSRTRSGKVRLKAGDETFFLMALAGRDGVKKGNRQR
jgi:hypothetical protein